MAQIDAIPGAPQFLGQFQGRSLRRLTDGDYRHRSASGRRSAAQHGQTFDSRGPAHAGRLWAAHHADQSVIAAAGHHGALRAQMFGGELKGGVAVIVETTHQPSIDPVGNVQRVQPFAHRAEKIAAGLVQIL